MRGAIRCGGCDAEGDEPHFPGCPTSVPGDVGEQRAEGEQP